MTNMVMTGGRIRTMNPAGPWAEALAVRDGRIAYVGSDSDAAAWIGPETTVLRLDGRLALPAFVDAHMHPASGAFRHVYCLSLFGINAEDPAAAYRRAAADFARTHPETAWLQGAGFRRAAFDDLGPRREWLDEADADRPFSIISRDGHSMWVNSKALDLAGIAAGTPDPPGGVIQRDPLTGRPSGLLQEAAMDLVLPLIPRPTKNEIKQSLLWLQEWLNREGITTAHDAILEIDAPEVYQAYQELAEEGRLTVRYRGSWRLYPHRDWAADIDRALDLARRLADPRFQARSFKFFADEVIEEETAYLLEAYTHRPDGWRGIRGWTDEDLTEALTRVYRAGFQAHIHAIGDGAVRYAVDALERAADRTGRNDLRPNLAHLQMVSRSDFPRLAALDATAVVSPYWATMDDYFWDMYVPYLGRRRAFEAQYPLKSFIRAGVNAAVHSDFSVTEPDLMWAVYSALTRQLPRRVFEAQFAGNPAWSWSLESKSDPAYGEFVPLPPEDERLSLDEALDAATRGGAYANFLEKDLGALTPGRLADLVVMDRDLYRTDVEEIPEAKADLTLFEGRIVHRAPDADL
jgi:hypothetical protein